MSEPEQQRPSVLQGLGHRLAKAEATVQTLVELCDELRQPLNNTRYHALYVKACDVLNKIDEERFV